MRRSIVLAVACVGVQACTSTPVSPSLDRGAQASQAQAPAVSAARVEDTAPAPANAPPRVSIVSGSGSCHPRNYPIAPCTVAFRAAATDPDGDALSYTWHGCATGSSATAECRINTPGEVTVEVVVTDGRGGSARATASAKGVNQRPSPPLLRCFAYCCLSGTCPCDGTVPAGERAACWWDADRADPDGDVIGCGTPTADGACRSAGLGQCTGHGHAIEVDFRADHKGVCTVSVPVQDEWGAVGKAVAVVTVTAP